MRRGDLLNHIDNGGEIWNYVTGDVYTVSNAPLVYILVNTGDYQPFFRGRVLVKRSTPKNQKTGNISISKAERDDVVKGYLDILCVGAQKPKLITRSMLNTIRPFDDYYLMKST